MKSYTISRKRDGVHLQADALVKGQVVSVASAGYDIGNSSEGTKALARSIMKHYYNATEADPAAMAEVERKVKPFEEMFLGHHQMKIGAQYEISSGVIDRFMALPS